MCVCVQHWNRLRTRNWIRWIPGAMPWRCTHTQVKCLTYLSILEKLHNSSIWFIPIDFQKWDAPAAVLRHISWYKRRKILLHQLICCEDLSQTANLVQSDPSNLADDGGENLRWTSAKEEEREDLVAEAEKGGGEWRINLHITIVCSVVRRSFDKEKKGQGRGIREGSYRDCQLCTVCVRV